MYMKREASSSLHLAHTRQTWAAAEATARINQLPERLMMLRKRDRTEHCHVVGERVFYSQLSNLKVIVSRTIDATLIGQPGACLAGITGFGPILAWSRMNSYEASHSRDRVMYSLVSIFST